VQLCRGITRKTARSELKPLLAWGNTTSAAREASRYDPNVTYVSIFLKSSSPE